MSAPALPPLDPDAGLTACPASNTRVRLSMGERLLLAEITIGALLISLRIAGVL